MPVKGRRALIKDIRSILLIQLGDIGDVVLSLPCIRTLHDNFPKARVIVAVREKAKELIEDCPCATDVISVSKKTRCLGDELAYQKDFFLKLRRFRFDLAIDLRTGTRGAVLAFLSGARQRIGFYAGDGRLWRNRVFTDLILPELKVCQHLAEYYHILLDQHGLKIKHVWPQHVVPQEKKERVAALLTEEQIPVDTPLIAIQPFSLWRYKDWGADKYVGLIRWICSEYDVFVVVTGSVGERKRAGSIVNKCGRRHVYNLAGRTSIGMYAAVLQACQLFIGGDSVGIHLSAAVGIPTVSIFGPSSPASWAPRGDQHRIVQKDLPCVPCKDKGCEGSEVSRCLDALTVDEVISVVKGQLGNILGL